MKQYRSVQGRSMTIGFGNKYSLIVLAVLLAALVTGCGRGSGKTAALANPSGGTDPVTGDTTFWAWDFSATPNQAYTIKAAKVATGTHCYIYLENGKTLDQATITTIMNEFDNKIYLSTTTAFGSEPNPGVDNDPKITILLLDIKDGFNGTTRTSYIAGYFDEYDETTYADSNKREMFYMDLYPATPGSIGFFRTLAHEFQHMIHWEQKYHTYGLTHTINDTWLNEALSEISPVYSGYGVDYQRVYLFEKAPSDSLTVWGSTVYDYAVAYMWSQYLMDRYGAAHPDIFWNMVHNNKTGIDAVNTSLGLIDSSATFTTTFRDMSIALYSGNTITWKDHPEWSYTSLDTWSKWHDVVHLPGLFPVERWNIAAPPALSNYSFGFFSYTSASSAIGTVTWTSSSAVHAALADDSLALHDDLVSGQAYTYSIKGYLALSNLSAATAGSGSVANASIQTSTASTDAGGTVMIRSPKAKLDNASADAAIRSLSEMTGEPQAVCIHDLLEQRARASQGKGRQPFADLGKP